MAMTTRQWFHRSFVLYPTSFFTPFRITSLLLLFLWPIFILAELFTRQEHLRLSMALRFNLSHLLEHSPQTWLKAAFEHAYEKQIVYRIPLLLRAMERPDITETKWAERFIRHLFRNLRPQPSEKTRSALTTHIARMPWQILFTSAPAQWPIWQDPYIEKADTLIVKAGELIEQRRVSLKLSDTLKQAIRLGLKNTVALEQTLLYGRHLEHSMHYLELLTEIANKPGDEGPGKDRVKEAIARCLEHQGLCSLHIKTDVDTNEQLDAFYRKYPNSAPCVFEAALLHACHNVGDARPLIQPLLAKLAEQYEADRYVGMVCQALEGATCAHALLLNAMAPHLMDGGKTTHQCATALATMPDGLDADVRAIWQKHQRTCENVILLQEVASDVIVAVDANTIRTTLHRLTDIDITPYSDQHTRILCSAIKTALSFDPTDTALVQQCLDNMPAPVTFETIKNICNGLRGGESGYIPPTSATGQVIYNRLAGYVCTWLLTVAEADHRDQALGDAVSGLYLPIAEGVLNTCLQHSLDGKNGPLATLFFNKLNTLLIPHQRKRVALLKELSERKYPEGFEDFSAQLEQVKKQRKQQQLEEELRQLAACLATCREFQIHEETLTEELKKARERFMKLPESEQDQAQTAIDEIGKRLEYTRGYVQDRLQSIDKSTATIRTTLSWGAQTIAQGLAPLYRYQNDGLTLLFRDALTQCATLDDDVLFAIFDVIGQSDLVVEGVMAAALEWIDDESKRSDLRLHATATCLIQARDEGDRKILLNVLNGHLDHPNCQDELDRMLRALGAQHPLRPSLEYRKGFVELRLQLLGQGPAIESKVPSEPDATALTIMPSGLQQTLLPILLRDCLKHPTKKRIEHFVIKWIESSEDLRALVAVWTEHTKTFESQGKFKERQVRNLMARIQSHANSTEIPGHGGGGGGGGSGYSITDSP